MLLSASQSIHDLDEATLKFIVKNAGLGLGFIITEGSAPSDTGVSVIVSPPIDKINFQDTQTARIDTLVTSNPRSHEWGNEGYGKLKVAGETPVISGSVELPIDVSAENHAAGTELYFTGSYLMPKCKITFPVKNIANPDFDDAVREALAEADDKERAAALTRALDQYGHFYLTSVEMGGMKYIASTKRTDSMTLVSSLKAAMRKTASKRFGFGKNEGELSVGHSEKYLARLSHEFESVPTTTVGGDASIDSTAQWKKSLDRPNTWTAINKLTFTSVYTLFDPTTRAIIKATLVPKIKVQPLFRLWNGPGCDHFYTICGGEKEKVKNWPQWTFEGVAAQVLVNQVPDSIPLFRLWAPRQGDHFYTTDEWEANNAATNLEYTREGIVGYVYASQKEGTVPLYRSYHDAAYDHFYTIDRPEMDRAKGSWRFEKIQCYVYPPNYVP